jgi:hypothetical protein
VVHTVRRAVWSGVLMQPLSIADGGAVPISVGILVTSEAVFQLYKNFE